MVDLMIHGLLGGRSVIKSMQRGTQMIGYSNNTLDIAVSPVNLEKTVVLVNFRNTSNGQINSYFITAELINSTTIRITRNSNGVAGVVAWQCIEMDVKSVQRGVKTITATNMTDDVSNYNIDKSFLIYNSRNIADFSNTVESKLYTATQLYFTTSVVGNQVVAYQLVEFN